MRRLFLILSFLPLRLLAVQVCWHCMIDTRTGSVDCALLGPANVTMGWGFWLEHGYGPNGYGATAYRRLSDSDSSSSYHYVYRARKIAGGSVDLPQSQIDHINEVQDLNMGTGDANLIDFDSKNFNADGLAPHHQSGAVITDSNGNPIGVAGYNSEGDMSFLPATFDSSTGTYSASGYNNQGREGTWHFSPSISPDIRIIGSFSPSSVLIPSGGSSPINAATSSFLGSPSFGSITYDFGGSPSFVVGSSANGSPVRYNLVSNGSGGFTANGYDSNNQPVIYNVTRNDQTGQWDFNSTPYDDNSTPFQPSQSTPVSTGWTAPVQLNPNNAIQHIELPGGDGGTTTIDIDLSEVVKGEQAILDYLSNGDGVPDVEEISLEDSISPIDDISVLEDDIKTVFEGTPYREGFEMERLHNVENITFLKSTLNNVFGALPSIGQSEFNIDFNIEAGVVSFPVSVNLSRFQLSTYRDAFAFIIMFLGAVAAVRIVGGAFE